MAGPKKKVEHAESVLTEHDAAMDAADKAQEVNETNDNGVSAFGLDWKNIPKLSDLQADFASAREFHDAHMEQVYAWREVMDGGKKQNNSKDPNRNTRSNVRPKVARKMAEWRYASLSEPFLSNDNLFEVSPRTWEDRNKARTNSILLNYQFKTHLNLTALVGELVRTVVNDGTAFLKPTWIHETRIEKQAVPIYEPRLSGDPLFEEALLQAVQLKSTSPSQFITEIPEPLRKSVEAYLEDESIIEYVQVETQYKDREVIVENRPYAEVWPIDDVYPDPACGTDYRRSRFVTYRVKTSLAELYTQSRYKNLELIRPRDVAWGSSSESTMLPAANFTYHDDIRAPIEMYEMWAYFDIDGTGQLKPIVVSWIGDTVVRMSLSPYSWDTLPIIAVAYMPILGTFLGSPDAELLEDNQNIKGAIMRGIIDIMARNATGQQGVPKGMLDAGNLTKFKNGEDYEYNPQFNPQQHVVNTQFSEIPQAAFNLISYLSAEDESLTGVKGFSDGLTQNSLGKVATAVRGVLDAASKRESDILRRIAEGVEELGRRFMAMNGEFLEEEEIIRITNDQFVTIHRTEVYGKYDLKISITTAEEAASRTDQLSFMLQTLVPVLGIEGSKPMLVEYATKAKMPDLAKAIETYQPQPDPFAEQMKQLQLEEQLLKNEQARMGLSTTAIEQAKTQSEILVNQAKASNLQSQSDLNSLEYLEQEKGVQHARDLQKLSAQAEANYRRDVAKSHLNQKAPEPTPANAALAKYIESITPNV